MINIPKKPKKEKRYEGLKPKLIHLNPKVFEILKICAERKNSNLKEYIEMLCTLQAKNEAESFIKMVETKQPVILFVSATYIN